MAGEDWLADPAPLDLQTVSRARRRNLKNFGYLGAGLARLLVLGVRHVV
jgi:hypothetical protein